MIADTKQGEFGREVDRIAREKVSMDAEEGAIDLKDRR